MEKTYRMLGQLSTLVEAEIEGRPFDAEEALRLAIALMPTCPTSVHSLRRMADRYTGLAAKSSQPQ
jgi:hypothetical protein